MGLAILVLGLVVFLAPHTVTAFRSARADLIARVGTGTYKAVYSIISLIGLVLIGHGFALYRAAGPIEVWYPPIWMRHVTVALVWPAIVCIVAAYSPGRIKTTLKHPFLVGVKLWALAHLALERRPRLDRAVRCDPGLGGVRSHFAQAPRRSGCAADPGRRRQERHHCGAGWHGSVCSARFVLPSLRDRRPRFHRLKHVGSRTDQAHDRAGHPRPQGRRADRMPDLLSRPHRTAGGSILRRHPGRRLAWHGDAWARDDGAGDARHDDPSGPCRDARLQAGAGGGGHAVRFLRGVQGAGLHERRASHEGNRLRRDQGRGRPAAGRNRRFPDRARRTGDGPCRPHPAGDQHHRFVPRPGPRGEGLGPDRG